MADDPLLGTNVGNYRLSYILGEGGMGRVYAAVHPKIAGRVAIKVLSSHAPDLTARFFAEAKAVNLIKHPAIVKVYDLAHLPDGRPYMAMEFVEGETLRRMLRRETLSVGGVAEVMAEALGALAAAHDIGIVHRDLKPDNIMITVDGATKVLDFGIAKLSPWLEGGAPRTVTGARMGTPAYMSPEQIRGGSVDPRTDVYSAGVALYEALTGTRPFPGDSEFELMRGHLEQTPPSPRSLRPQVPPELESVIMNALAKQPESRFQSARAMANALTHVVARLPADQQKRLVPQPSHAIELHSAQSASGPSGQDAVAFAATAAPARDHAPTVLDRAPRKPRPSRLLVTAAVLSVGAAVAIVTVLILIVVRRGEEPVGKRPSAAVAPPQPAMPQAPAKAAPKAAGVQTLATGAKELVKMVELDAKTFDPIAYIPTAQQMARELVDDVELFSFTSDAVTSDGRVTFEPQNTNLYTFISPSRRKPPPGTSPGAARLCIVAVSIRATQSGSIEARANAIPTTACDMAAARVPKCNLAKIWEKGKAKGASPEAVATIGWLMNRWVFQVRAVGYKPVSVTLKDTCE